MKWKFAPTRRRFLIAAGASLAALIAFGAGWLARRLRPREATGRDAALPAVGAGEQPEPDAEIQRASSTRARSDSRADVDGKDPAIPPETIPTLLVVADVIVPRSGDSPAASEIDLLPRLQRMIDASPSRARAYRENWVKLAEIIRDRVPVVDGKPDAAELERHLRIYHRRFRRTKSGGDLGNAFEQLRRDVLSIYYTSPEGRAWAGYAGRHVRPGGRAS